MIAAAMVGWRNPARYLVPLALVATAAAAYTIVHRAVAHHHPAPAPVLQTTTPRQRTGHHGSSKAKFYVVRPNDTLSKISARTGVSVTTIETLNPSVNPNALQPAQRLRLRR